MKKMCISIVALSLMASGLLASRMVGGWEYFEKFSEEGVNRLQEAYKDADKVESHLRIFFRDRSFLDEVPLLFKRKFDVSDETLRTALMSIARESSAKAGWEIGGQTDEPSKLAMGLLDSSIRWLGVCADTEAKQFLMDIATDNAKHISYRGEAIRAYLRCADAQETRDAILRFLAGDMRVTVDPYYIYSGSMQAYDEAEGDPLKREAIVATLAVTLAREDERRVFMLGDKELATRSKKYAESSQRLAILRRMNKFPPTNWYDDHGNLDPVIQSIQSRKTFTSVSTNLTELMARDFRKPAGKGGQ